MADYDIGEAFRAIEHELIASMTRNLTNHKVEELVEGYEWAQWQAMQLEALEEYKRRNAAKFPKQFSEINDRIEQEINSSYSDAQTAQEREILKRIHSGTPAPTPSVTAIQGEFFKVNSSKMDALADAVTSDMQKAEYAVLRMADDQYRRIIFNAQVYMNSGAATYKKAVDMATKDFLAAGINCIEYSDGRRVPIDAYAEMALRTANKRAYLQGEGDMRKKWGIHTVILNKRTNACPKCAPFCGQIIVDDVWSGGTAEEAEKGGYLLMSDCIAHGLYHPNCQDSHTTYFGDLLGDDEDEEQTESEIMPLPENEVRANTDSAEYLLQQYTPEEQQRNVELYNAEQRGNYCQRQVQRFERLSEFSLDPDNKREYRARLSQWKGKLSEARKNISDITKTVAISAGSGIIEEGNKKAVTVITEKAIDRVPCVYIAGYTEQQNKYIQQQHKELLNYARSKNSSNEVAFVFSSDFSIRKEFLGSDDRISFSSSGLGMNIVVLHNHPRNSSYSLNDVIEFVSNSSIKTLSIVKNNGLVETLTKLQTVDKEKLLLELNRLIKKKVKNGLNSEYDKVVREFLTKKSEGGVFEWLK